MGICVPYHAKKPEYAGVAHWWRTSLYNAELLLHHRLRNHLCLTPHPSQAHLFYVPFYPGLQLEHVLGFSNTTIDEYYDDLAQWIRRQPAFKRYGAKDHFFGLGRTTWLFRRSLSPVLDGSNLEQMPEFMPMMKLEVERYAWDDQDSFGLPFPTDFHPISTKQLRRWQATVRSAKRPYQFACIIPPDSKEPEAATKTRAAVVQQCQAPSTSCALLNCSRGDCSHEQVMDLYLSAQYAVQDGSNFGLRYLMDSLVAGAVPVMLWNRTYALYHHHFPSNPDSFSVYLPYIDVPEWTTVEHRLSKVAPSRYRALQLQVIHMIPSLIYVDPSHVLSNVRDAVDIAIDHMVDLWRDRKARHEYPVPATASEPVGRGELVRAFASKSDAATGESDEVGTKVSAGEGSSGAGGEAAGKEVRGEGTGDGSGGAGGASDVDFMAAVIIDEGLAAEVAAREQTDKWKALAEELRLDAASALALAMEEFEEVQSGTGVAAAEMSVLLCTDAYIRELNSEWRGVDAPTDVLSFPQDQPPGLSPLLLLGDVIISVETAQRQANERGHSLLDELRILMVHGMLHLLGYDHEAPKGTPQGAADSAMSEAELAAAVRESAEQMATEELRILEAFAWRGVGLVAAAMGEEGGGAQGGGEGRGEAGGEGGEEGRVEGGGEEGEKGGVKARMTRIGMVQGVWGMGGQLRGVEGVEMDARGGEGWKGVERNVRGEERNGEEWIQVEERNASELRCDGRC
ncbi:unnamed protein product [Closterium sp. Naga37s-1]|nr:unnamed protein product [Closterium sp. Naga37s-1]